MIQRPEAIDHRALEDASGGKTQQIFTNVSPDLEHPSHQYGLASDVFYPSGVNGMSQFDQANDLIQRFNAPTADGLYGNGNDPNSTTGTVSRPGAQDLAGVTIPGTDFPLDHGGNVTLFHGDGYARNTTVDYQHPLEGTITRNLVVDLNEGGGFQTLTLGQGHDGAQLATLGGEVAGSYFGQWGADVGATLGQNGSHIINPELGNQAFSRLDDAMLANLNGTANPNLAEPGGRLAELQTSAMALGQGVLNSFGLNLPEPTGTPQQQLVYDLAQNLNTQGPVDGYFMMSSAGPGVYHMTETGSTYYERGPDGQPVATPVDEFGGVDAAIAHQAELDAANPTPAATASGDIALPELPAALPPLESSSQVFDDGSTLTTNPDGTTTSTDAAADPVPATQTFDDGSTLTTNGNGTASSTDAASDAVLGGDGAMNDAGGTDALGGSSSNDDLGGDYVGSSGSGSGSDYLGGSENDYAGSSGSDYLGDSGSDYLGSSGSDYLSDSGSDYLGGSSGSDYLGDSGSDYLGDSGSDYGSSYSD